MTGAVQWYAGGYPLPDGGSDEADLFYPPTGSPPAPIVIVVHGGGWVEGDKVQIAQLAIEVAQHGYVTLCMDYPLATTSMPGWDDQVQDVEALIALAQADGAAWGGDPSRIAVWGHSAGATLAVMAAARNTVKVQAAIGFSGVYDVPAAIEASPSLTGVIQPWTGCDPSTSGCAVTAADASAVTHVTSAAPPMYLAQSASEFIPRNQLDNLASALTTAGVPHQTAIIPGDSHGWIYPDDQIAPALAWLDGVLHFTPPSPSYSAPTVDPITAWYMAGASPFIQAVSERYSVAGGMAQDFDVLTAYWTASVGTVRTVQGAIRDLYRTIGGPTGVLAWPTTDERTTPDGIGRYSHFTGTRPAGSSIYWTPQTGAHEVLGAIRARWAQLGWERSYLGYPTSGEYPITGGRRSDFQHGYITWTASGGAVDGRY